MWNEHSQLWRVPLVEHPVLGPCDLYQLRIARSDSRGSSQDDHLPLHVIREMFQTSETADLIATQLHARRAEQLVDQIVDIFQDHTGTSPNMSPLADMMREIHASIEEMMPDKTSSQPKTTSAPVVRPLEDSALNCLHQQGRGNVSKVGVMCSPCWMSCVTTTTAMSHRALSRCFCSDRGSSLRWTLWTSCETWPRTALLTCRVGSEYPVPVTITDPLCQLTALPKRGVPWATAARNSSVEIDHPVCRSNMM